MAHPQHNFTSNFNGSDGHNAELTLNINGVEKKYTPAGNDQTYNVPGVARIDINLDGADLVQAIQTALDGAAQPVLAEMSVYGEEVVYQYIGDMDGCWHFGISTADIIITLAVDKTDGSIGTREIPVANGVVIVPTDGLAIYSQLRSAIALGQLPVLSYVGANPVYAQYEKTADNGDLVFVGAFATKSTSNRIQCIIYKVASDNTITTETYASFSGSYNDLSNKPNLATVATSGSYNDLSNKPSIPAAQVQSDWSQSNNTKVDYIKNKPNLATVATSGSYNDLSNKPTIPAAQVNSDWNANSGVTKILNKPNLATVATSGSYADLSNKPSIPAAQVQSDWNEADTTKADYIKNKPNLASVATSGNYNDLSNKPNIPPSSNIVQYIGTSGQRYLTSIEVTNKYADVTSILPVKFWLDFAILHVSLHGMTLSNGTYEFLETDLKYSVYVGNANNPTAVLIREIPLLGASDRDDMGRLIGDLTVNETAYFVCTMLGQGIHLVCDRVTVRIDWSDNRTTFGLDTSSWFQLTGNRIFLTMPDDTSLWPPQN